MDTDSTIDFNHIKDNPEALLLLISKYAKIHLIKGKMFIGFIYSIDPVTLSIILLVPQKNKHESFQKILIPGHAIIDITEEQCESSIKMPVMVSSIRDPSDIKKRKERLMEWLRLNLLTVTESDENILFGNVAILPPYGTTDICTNNPIIALQVQKIINKMPEDFNSLPTNKIDDSE